MWASCDKLTCPICGYSCGVLSAHVSDMLNCRIYLIPTVVASSVNRSELDSVLAEFLLKLNRLRYIVFHHLRSFNLRISLFARNNSSSSLLILALETSVLQVRKIKATHIAHIQNFICLPSFIFSKVILFSVIRGASLQLG